MYLTEPHELQYTYNNKAKAISAELLELYYQETVRKRKTQEKNRKNLKKREKSKETGRNRKKREVSLKYPKGILKVSKKYP